MALYESRETADRIADRIKVFAQSQRLMILAFLLNGEHTVGEIETATGILQPALSQQLAELRRAELVKTRRVSKQIYYELADHKIARSIETIEEMFGDGDVRRSPSPAIKPRIDQKTARSGASVFARVEAK
jgi:DNA-binding transcriptional ArsR family regulator